MDETTLLRLPYIAASQAQKHVTHNEALRMLDAILHIRVEDRDRDTPPETPAEGERHIVGSTPNGAFSGQSGKIAAYQDGAWTFLAPRPGWIVWDATESALLVFDGSAWTPAKPDPVTLPLLGVNATADETNRLSVSADATLFNHAGSGHQLKVNKAANADTGTLLFQTAWSGRAEMGLAGDDNFALKVSADGATWTTALKAAGDDGAVRIDSLGVGIDAPEAELHLFSTRATGLNPHMLIRSGKTAGQAACVAYQRATSSQQMLFAFETGSSSSPDGYFGTFAGKTGALYIITSTGAPTHAAIGVDKTLGLRVGTAADIVSGAVGATIAPDGAAAFAEPMAIGTSSADVSALLDLASTTRGFLPPRMTTTERDAIATPATGLMIFNQTNSVPEFWNGSTWVAMG